MYAKTNQHGHKNGEMTILFSVEYNEMFTKRNQYRHKNGQTC